MRGGTQQESQKKLWGDQKSFGAKKEMAEETVKPAERCAGEGCAQSACFQ